MHKIEKLVIIGFGGHARSVGDVAAALGINSVVFVDPNAHDGESFATFQVVKEFSDQLYDGRHVFPAAGDNIQRERQYQKLRGRIATLIAKEATVGMLAQIGEGTFLGRHAHVGPLARIGKGVILNTSSVTEHDCSIGDFSHVSVNSTIAGRSRIGRRVMVGAGAVVKDNLTIGDDVIIGAGAVVAENIAEPGVYVGVPARKIR